MGEVIEFDACRSSLDKSSKRSFRLRVASTLRMGRDGSILKPSRRFAPPDTTLRRSRSVTFVEALPRKGEPRELGQIVFIVVIHSVTDASGRTRNDQADQDITDVDLLRIG